MVNKMESIISIRKNETVDFVQRIYNDVDSLDIRKLLAHLTEDCSFTFANSEPLVGHSAIETSVGGFMQLFNTMVHEVEQAWRIGDIAISQLRVIYTRKDGIQRSYPAAVIWHMRGELIQDFRIYVDNTTLFS